MRRSFAFVLLALVLADAIAFVPGARAAPSQVIFNTTAAFDGGTKASVGTATDTCENVTANALQLNNTGNYQGIGLTTGTSTCATGAWGVSASGLKLAYDMQTLSTGKMKDFSGNGNDGTIVGTTAVSGKFGNARNLPNPTGGTATNTITRASFTTPFGDGNVSLAFWIKFNSLSAQENLVRISRFGTQSRFIPYTTAAGFFAVFCNNMTTGSLNVVSALKAVTGIWYPIAVVISSYATKLYVNGTSIANGNCPQPMNQLNEMQTIGGDYGTFAANATFDDLLLSSRPFSVPEVTAFSTDGRSSLATSGSWQSPSQTLTSAPTLATITFSGGTSTNRPSRLRVYSAQSGPVVFDKLIPSGLASPVQIPLNLTFFPPTWSVKLDMVGNGSASAFVSSIVLSLAGQPTLDTNAWTFVMLITALLLFLGLSYYTDSVLPFIPAAFVTMIIGFEAWNVILPGGDPATAWMVLVSFIGFGCALLVLPIRAAFHRGVAR